MRKFRKQNFTLQLSTGGSRKNYLFLFLGSQEIRSVLHVASDSGVRRLECILFNFSDVGLCIICLFCVCVKVIFQRSAEISSTFSCLIFQFVQIYLKIQFHKLTVCTYLSDNGIKMQPKPLDYLSTSFTLDVRIHCLKLFEPFCTWLKSNNDKYE